MKPALLPGLALVDLIERVPLLKLVLVAFVNEVVLTTPPRSPVASSCAPCTAPTLATSSPATAVMLPRVAVMLPPAAVMLPVPPTRRFPAVIVALPGLTTRLVNKPEPPPTPTQFALLLV